MYDDGRYFCDCGYGVDLDEDLICEQCRGVEATAFRERIAYLESALAARDRAAGKGSYYDQVMLAFKPCCALCSGEVRCTDDCPTVLFPLEGK